MQENVSYTCALNSTLGKAISNFMSSCSAASQAADKWLKEIGATEYMESPMGMAGGVAFVRFPKNVLPPLGIWKPVEIDGEKWYETRAELSKDSEAFEQYSPEAIQIERQRLALPVVSEMDLVALLMPEQKIIKGHAMPFRLLSTPIIFLYHGEWHIDIHWKCTHPELKRLRYDNFKKRLEIVGKE